MNPRYLVVILLTAVVATAGCVGESEEEEDGYDEPLALHDEKCFDPPGGGDEFCVFSVETEDHGVCTFAVVYNYSEGSVGTTLVGCESA